MRKQALIIGLGQFGRSLATRLTEQGVEVLGVDRNPELVQSLSTQLAHTASFDATDELALAEAAPKRRDICICAIGDESRESAILVTALLRQMGAPKIVARATDELMERILRLVGAHEVVNPERAFGNRFSMRLLVDGVIDEIPLGEDLVITELEPPPEMFGRSLIELALPKTYGATVVAIRREVEGRGTLEMPAPSDVIRPDDILVIVSKPGVVKEILGQD